MDSRIPVKVALAYVNGRPVARHWYSIVAIVSLSLLAERYEQVKEYYTSRNGRMSTYIDQLLAEYKSIDHGTFQSADKEEEQGAGQRYADIIFNNWKASFLRGNGALQTGIYQMFRRYKPESELSSIEVSNDQTNVINHAVICELIYVDSDAMECLMITSGGNIYYGTMYINHEKILYGILQRRNHSGGINQRFISLKLESRRLPMYYPVFT